jgi:peptidoglycan-N-acetylglucosamine deacetylase
MRIFVGTIVLAAALALPKAQAAEPAVAIGVTPSAFSPNGDRIKDRVQVHVTVNEPGQLTVSLMRHGKSLATLDSETIIGGEAIGFKWDGCCGADGKPFADGGYGIRAKVGPAQGSPTAVALTRVVIDTAPPVVSRPHLSPVKLKRGPLRVRTRVRDLMPSVRLRLLLYGSDGKRLSAAPRVTVPTGHVSLTWRRVVQQLPGAYRAAISASDGLGNVGMSRQRPLLVEHPVHSRVWARFVGVGRHIALTFDDCNFADSWRSILHTLHRFHVHATFFCPGQRVLADPALARKTIKAGHAVGSHGWDHANLPTLSYGAQLWRLVRDRDVWWHVARTAATPLFRPPYGAYNSSTVAAAGRAGYAATVLWDVDPRDWSSPGVAAIIQRVVSGTRAGSIVLMHVVPETAAALPTIIARLKARHFKPVTLPRLARMGRPSPGGWPHSAGH